MNCPPQVRDVTTLIVNYRTYKLTARCVESFLYHYSEADIILIDNGSCDESTEYFRTLAEENPNISSIINKENIYHGPALDQGIRASRSPLVFTLDSDCEIKRGGFLEEMLMFFNHPNMYAVGNMVYMDRFGYEVLQAKRGCHPYIHPSRMLLDRAKYLGLERFIHHGSPAIKNMRHALHIGYRLIDFPVDAYIDHIGRGTNSLYGYNLGMRHKVEYVLKWVTDVFNRY